MLSLNKIIQAVCFGTVISVGVNCKPSIILVQPSLENAIIASAYYPEPPAELDGGSRFSGGEKQETKSINSDFSDDSDRVRREV